MVGMILNGQVDGGIDAKLVQIRKLEMYLACESPCRSCIAKSLCSQNCGRSRACNSRLD